eukprot:10188045-Alexandrium_andersonii.AAC.1
MPFPDSPTEARLGWSIEGVATPCGRAEAVARVRQMAAIRELELRRRRELAPRSFAASPDGL